MTFSTLRTGFCRTLALSCLLSSCAVFAHEEHGEGHATPPAAGTPVQRTAAGAVYGVGLPADAPPAIDIGSVPVVAATATPAAYSGRITEVCQKQGCWMVLSGESGAFARVFMHGHAFSVPKDARGAAVVYGTLREKKLDAAEIGHMKKDGARSPAPRELQIDATSVLIQSG